MTSSHVAARAVIVGRVQGVCYRAWASEQASSLGLGGWVRNRLDGSVEAHFEGPRRAVETMLALCREGPAHAQVAQLDVHWLDPEGHSSFRVTR